MSTNPDYTAPPVSLIPPISVTVPEVSQPPARPVEEELPITGSNLALIMAFGLVLLILGASILVNRRARRS